ncbi:MAG: HAD-IIIA family hydrolase [Planctomycetes bacterium]|nr:HAD-IIIA family hydrolase [Planctomycetota bacterium]
MRTRENQAVFFELDGVVMSQARLTPAGTVPYLRGALDSLARIDGRHFRLFVATNREDIAFGRLKERDFRQLCDVFLADCQKAGIRIDKIYSCPYHPKGRAKFKRDSVFRKPAPGMFKMAQQEFDLNLARCWMIGHSTVDMLAASRAGTGTILVRTGQGGRDGLYVVDPHFTEPDLPHAVARLLGFEYALQR